MATFQGSWPLISLKHPCPSPPIIRTNTMIEHGHGSPMQPRAMQALPMISISHWRMRCTSCRWSASGGRRRRIMAEIGCAATVNDGAAPPGNLVGVGQDADTGAAKPPPPPPGPCIRKRRQSGAAAAAVKLHGEDDHGEEEEWLRYLEPAKLELFAQLEPWAEANLLPFLKPVEAAWQPADMLPDAAALGEEGFREACSELRARAAGVPDAHLVCLVGNTVTEEALPTYQSMLNRPEPIRDFTGASATAWARWIRGWTAEENRHGDVLNRYLFLSGRVDMRQVERTVHHLIQAGMAMSAAAVRSPHHSVIYAAFQERATAISHGNMARRAKDDGDSALARICGAVAADEKRHEAAYTAMMGKLFDVDPDDAVRALAYMMRRRITMPASLVTDGRDGDLFAHFAAVAQSAGVYTASDYRGILEHMIKQWRVEELGEGLSGEGRRAQDYVCELPEKFRRLEEKAHERSRAQKPTPSVPFSWVFDRPVNLTVG